MAVVLNEDKAERYTELTQVDDLVTCECIRYGISNNTTVLPGIISLSYSTINSYNFRSLTKGDSTLMWRISFLS